MITSFIVNGQFFSIHGIKENVIRRIALQKLYWLWQWWPRQTKRSVRVKTKAIHYRQKTEKEIIRNLRGLWLKDIGRKKFGYLGSKMADVYCYSLSKKWNNRSNMVANNDKLWWVFSRSLIINNFRNLKNRNEWRWMLLFKNRFGYFILVGSAFVRSKWTWSLQFKKVRSREFKRSYIFCFLFVVHDLFIYFLSENIFIFKLFRKTFYLPFTKIIVGCGIGKKPSIVFHWNHVDVGWNENHIAQLIQKWFEWDT